MNRLHIAIIHDSKIPALKYGGTERVIWWLGEALTQLGHIVTYIVPKGSQCHFAKIKEFNHPNYDLNQIVPDDVDIIHSFTTTPRYRPEKPFICTIGGNGQTGETYHHNTVFVSKNHASRHGTEAFVHNGINPKYYPVFDEESIKEDYCFFLANASWKVKNVKGAIKVAKKAGLPIKIMGGKGLGLSKRVKWMGMVGGDQKNLILEKGAALLFPVRWHEPFGIAIIEALLTGSPVFGTPYGSLPELINEDIGFLSNNIDELALALKNYNRFNKSTCRNHVLNNLTHLHMAEKYLDYYEHILKGRQLSKKEPRTIRKFKTPNLLDFK